MDNCLLFDSGDGDEKVRPVMIHRAILGSVERMIAILTEHTGGKWPFWLSPRQAAIVPVDPIFNEYADQVRMRAVSYTHLTLPTILLV